MLDLKAQTEGWAVQMEHDVHVHVTRMVEGRYSVLLAVVVDTSVVVRMLGCWAEKGRWPETGTAAKACRQ